MRQGTISSEPYTSDAIDSNLTDQDDFTDQFNSVVDRIVSSAETYGTDTAFFLCTLPYYSSVGYLFDSEDLEFYLKKANSNYHLPPSFNKVVKNGAGMADYTTGDRVSLFTFYFMYLLLSDGASVEYVNRALETDGAQRDGLVLSETELHHIMSRIDSFNESIENAAAGLGPGVHYVDTGGYLNDVLTGSDTISVYGTTLSRSWGRGNSFTLDGVHPGYTGHALIANYILMHINETTGLNAPEQAPEDILAEDPYVDRDGDGWVPGPDYSPQGFTEILFLLKDPDDADPTVQPVLPANIWRYISDILLDDMR